MIASGFKPVGWVAGVGAAALGCYMLSLQVAAERASLAGLDHRIVEARQQIRSLQTELGTRGRIQQLESWNDQVLALSAPVSGQFVEGQVSLARFDSRQPSAIDPATVRMASADATATAPMPAPTAPPTVPAPQRAVATASAVAPSTPVQQASVQRTSLTALPAPAPAASFVPNRPTASPAPATARATPPAGQGRPNASTTARTAPLAEARRPASATPRSGQTPATANRTRLAANEALPAPVRSGSPARAVAPQSAARQTPATPPVRTAVNTNRDRAAAAPTPARSTPLLSDRALRDLRNASRAERERGTDN